MRSLAVVTAGLSSPSTTRQLADALSDTVDAEVGNRGEELTVRTIELRELADELAAAMTNWSAPTPNLDAAKETVVHADGLVAITPVFQGSYSGLFKMFFDTFSQHSLEELPTILGATAGSARHSLILDYSLRPLFNYLHAVVVPTGVFQATEDFGTSAGARLNQRIHKAARQLADFIVRPIDRVEGLTGPLPAGHESRSEADTLTGPSRAPQAASFQDLLRQHDGSGDR